METRIAADSIRDPLPVVRRAVHDLLLSCEAFRELHPGKRRELAEAMVTVCHRAAVLLREEIESAQSLSPAAPARPQSIADHRGLQRDAQPVLARAQSAGSEFSGVAAERVAATTRQILNAVSFPRFVTELINGVFKAMLDSNQQQMHAFVELLKNVSASTDGFADANLGSDRAREWLADRYPGSFEIDGEEAENGWGNERQASGPDAWSEGTEPPQRTLRLRPGAAMPSADALRVDLGLAADESVAVGDLERTLVPLARRALARQRQQMLATMVMLGMQRIVIDSGRIHASMRFHIDTHSAAAEDRGSQFDARHTSTVSGSFGYGPWGASATMTNTIGYVSTQRTQTTEEMNTDLDLNSSVELVFKTDYLPLERLAGQGQIDRIKVNTLNPEAEVKAASEARTAREKRLEQNETVRRSSIDRSIVPPPTRPTAPASGQPGSPEAADRARREAATKEKQKAGAERPPPTTSTPGTAAPGNVSATTAPGEAPSTSTPRAPSSAAGPSARTPATTPAAPATGHALAVPARGRPVGETDLDDQTRVPAPTFPSRAPDVVFVPSPDQAVVEMLTLARVKRGDLVYDLGCGDGRIVIAAAKQHGCRATGFDVDPRRVAEARRNVERDQVSHLVRIEQRDMFTVDLSAADIVFVYLLPELNVKLVPQFEQMKTGARIVSQDFDMAGVIPDRVVQVYLEKHQFYKTFYLWTTPLKHASKPIPHEWLNARGIRPAAARHRC